MKNLQKSYLRNFISIILIVSMLFTTSGMATFADSVGKIIETNENGNIDKDNISYKYYDDLIDTTDKSLNIPSPTDKQNLTSTESNLEDNTIDNYED